MSPIRFSKQKPVDGECVLWVWARAGQITAGDFFNGKPRDASKDYAEIETRPSHWLPWPDWWPK